MEKLNLDIEKIEELEDKELAKLASVAWWDENMELQFLLDRELSRRRQQADKEADPDD